VRTLIPVAEGEELTIDYYLGVRDTAPVHVRRTAVANSCGFLCECPWCSAFGDDTRKNITAQTAPARGDITYYTNPQVMTWLF
jgi:hypothetical protein